MSILYIVAARTSYIVNAEMYKEKTEEGESFYPYPEAWLGTTHHYYNFTSERDLSIHLMALHSNAWQRQFTEK